MERVTVVYAARDKIEVVANSQPGIFHHSFFGIFHPLLFLFGSSVKGIHNSTTLESCKSLPTGFGGLGKVKKVKNMFHEIVTNCLALN